MSEMVERVARAMWRRWDKDVEAMIAGDDPEGAMRLLASAAITAMHETTDRMAVAGSDAARIAPGRANQAWRAMIDEALR